YFTSDYVEHVPTPPGMPSGIEGSKAFFSSLHAAFPDFHYTVEDCLAEGDWVAQRVTGHGTMQAAFLGMPPTGKQAHWSEMHITRVQGSKFVEHWANMDQLGMLQQLGLVPMPGGGS